MAATKIIRERIEDGMREVGILLIAFAPLGAVLAERNRVPPLLLFLLLGLGLFIGALILESRHHRWATTST